MRDAEAKSIIAELQSDLADAKIAVAEMKAQNMELWAALEKATAAAGVAEDLAQRGDAYYRTNAPPGKPKGPFCMRCSDSDSKLIVLTKMGPSFDVIGTHHCPQCKSVVSL